MFDGQSDAVDYQLIKLYQKEKPSDNADTPDNSAKYLRFAAVFVHDHCTAAARGLMNLLRGLNVQCLVWAFGVVKGKVLRQTHQQLPQRGVSVEVHVFVLG
jgi:hypothetical protein